MMRNFIITINDGTLTNATLVVEEYKGVKIKDVLEAAQIIWPQTPEGIREWVVHDPHTGQRVRA